MSYILLTILDTLAYKIFKRMQGSQMPNASSLGRATTKPLPPQQFGGIPAQIAPPKFGQRLFLWGSFYLLQGSSPDDDWPLTSQPESTRPTPANTQLQGPTNRSYRYIKRELNIHLKRWLPLSRLP